MPMKPGHSRQVVSQNIKEMVASGHKPRQAIAAALANARKSKKMAEGGMVDSELQNDALGSVDSAHDEGEAGEPINPDGSDQQGLSANVVDVQALAKALQEADHKSNNNSNSFEADDSVAGSKMSKGGQVQSEHGEALGTKPDLGWIDADTAEPMSDEPAKAASMDHTEDTGVPMSMALSEEAKAAIAAKKKKRVYGNSEPK